MQVQIYYFFVIRHSFVHVPYFAGLHSGKVLLLQKVILSDIVKIHKSGLITSLYTFYVYAFSLAYNAPIVLCRSC